MVRLIVQLPLPDTLDLPISQIYVNVIYQVIRVENGNFG